MRKNKYAPGAKVYCYLKTGLQLVTIESVMIHIQENETSISYWIKEYSRESYNEDQIIPSLHHAKKKLIENSNQLQLAIG